MHLHHDSLSFLSLASRFATFFDILTRACAEIKTLRPMSLGFSIFGFFFAFPFLFFLLQRLAFYWGCLRLKNFYESVIETGNF